MPLENKITKILVRAGIDIDFTTKEVLARLSMRDSKTLEAKVKVIKKEIRKEDNTYNAGHVEEKYAVNKIFVEAIEPRSILDLFCGIYSFYKSNGYRVITNDNNPDVVADYHMDALVLLNNLIQNGAQFDIVDVDPYNSPAIYIVNALKVAQKGIIITFGDHWSNIHYKKKDFIYSTYGFSYVGDKIPKKDLMEHQIRWCQSLAKDLGKELEVFKAIEWWKPRTGDCPCYRVWFRII